MFEVNKHSCKKFIDSPLMEGSCSSARLDLRCSSEHVASATFKLDEVPTHVRSEHQLK